MSTPTRITSSTNARVKRVVKLRQHRERRKTGLFIAEGRRELTRAVAAGLTVREVFVCPQLLGEDLARACPDIKGMDADVPCFDVTPTVFRKMAYLREPEGVLAVVAQRTWALSDLPAADARTLYLIAVGIEKPGNLGAMVRTAEAAGCAAVLAAGSAGEAKDAKDAKDVKGAIDVYNPNAIRASTCAVFSLPTVSAPAEAVLHWLADRGVRVMAATPRGAVAHTEARWDGPTAIAIGPEDTGLDNAWLHAADRTGGQRVAITMQGRLVDSLNASAAAAVLLFEARRALGVSEAVG